MPKPPVSFSLAAAISLECLHVLDSNYLPCDTHRATVKSHTLLHIGNILAFKNGASTMCKKIQKQTHRNLPLAIANQNISLATRGVQNLWTPKAFVCKVGLVKKRVLGCFVQNRELFLHNVWLDYIIPLSLGTGRASGIWKESRAQIFSAKTPFWWGVLRGPVRDKMPENTSISSVPSKKR